MIYQLDYETFYTIYSYDYDLHSAHIAPSALFILLNVVYNVSGLTMTPSLVIYSFWKKAEGGTYEAVHCKKS